VEEVLAMNGNLMDLHPYVRRKALQLIEMGAELGVKILITLTKLSSQEQANRYVKGRLTEGKRITNCRMNDSLHIYGLAFDVSCEWAGLSSEVSEKQMYHMIGALGERIGLLWDGEALLECGASHFSWKGELSLTDIKRGMVPKEVHTTARPKYTKRYTRMDAKVRRKPSLDSPVIDYILENTPIKVYAEAGGWALIEYLGRRAYIYILCLK
jgi:peptidoglycan L-alanyl-D-glutamate endopeptidase CwlK